MNKFLRKLLGPNIRFFAEEGAPGAVSDPIETKPPDDPPPVDTGAVKKNWTESVDGWDTDTQKAMAKFATPQDAAKGYVELQKKQGTMISPPDPNAKPEEAAAKQRDILSKLGLPDESSGYEFKYPAELDEKKHMGDRERAEFLTMAHQEGMLPNMVQGVINFMSNSNLSSERTAIPDAIKNANTLIRAEYPETAVEMMQFSRQVAEEFGGEEAVNRLFSVDGKPIDGLMNVLLAKVGEQAYGETPFHHGTTQQRVEAQKTQLKLKQRYPKTED